MSKIDQKIFEEARVAFQYVVDGARYQLEAAHRRPTGELDDTYEAAHDELIAHIREEFDAVGTYGDMSKVVA